MEKSAIRKLGDIIAQYLGVKIDSNEAKDLFICQDWETLNDGDTIWLEDDSEKLGLLDYIKDLQNYKVTVCQEETYQDWEVTISLPCGSLLLLCSTEPLI